MKKYLLDPAMPFFKANLHCHSTISDGVKTPQELKEMYKNEGYSIIAYTDHDILLDRSDLCDKDFLALNGYEIEINQQGGEFCRIKTCHLCCIALEQNNLIQSCYHRERYLHGNSSKYRHLIQYDETKPDFVREYSADGINKIISECRENGFFVTYNHPSWSLENLNEYGKYIGMNAMEICNYGCIEEGYDDYNEKEYDDILRGGQRVFCISADDNHNYGNDSFGGFTCINAEKLEYRIITSALENGKFYASQGPKINELWYEDGKIGIKCSSAAQIVLNTGIRRTEISRCKEGAELNEAIFNVGENDIYVRVTVTDFTGKHANTNAYFVDELLRK